MADSRAPKYHRMADALRREIRDGELPPGHRLPAETALSERFRISLPTVRQALSVLRAEGLIESRHGVGTFVKEQRRLQRRSRGRYGSARGHGKLLTHHLRHDIVFAGRGEAPAHIAEIMGLKPGAEVVIRRRNLFDKETGQPEEIGASYLPVEVAGGTYLEEPKVVPKALFLCVEELTGRHYTRARDQWIARMPTADEAATLELPNGAAVLHVVHTARDENGNVLEISESVWPADRVVVIDDYDIEQAADEPSAPSEV
ncbi:GntR family transcriptional regulator [Allokutzneria albata]|uniref:Transcriptional regulator, GntR family n=1 Tax=Allokutzneria albata TaxID=211114 RepID=A0A1H0CL54_ALLAB|nr:GntR family transcriptional regulator [Allokutzneria albata]SDN58628.1 transcriptional regulator, GntR family [Allokutzneria albata]